MKNFRQLLIIGFAITFLGCYSGDDDYFLRNVEVADAFVFENAGNYVVGDTIYIELNFSRYLKEENYANLLDIYETTGSEKFNYSLLFSKFSSFSNSFETIGIADEFLFAEKGEVLGISNEVKVVLNGARTMYESRIGIVLAETGDFNFDVDYYSFYLYPENVGEDKVFFEVWHRFTDTDTDKFEFTVTE